MEVKSLPAVSEGTRVTFRLKQQVSPETAAPALRRQHVEWPLPTGHCPLPARPGAGPWPATAGLPLRPAAGFRPGRPSVRRTSRRGTWSGVTCAPRLQTASRPRSQCHLPRGRGTRPPSELTAPGLREARPRRGHTRPDACSCAAPTPAAVWDGTSLGTLKVQPRALGAPSCQTNPELGLECSLTQTRGGRHRPPRVTPSLPGLRPLSRQPLRGAVPQLTCAGQLRKTPRGHPPAPPSSAT